MPLYGSQYILSRGLIKTYGVPSYHGSRAAIGTSAILDLSQLQPLNLESKTGLTCRFSFSNIASFDGMLDPFETADTFALFQMKENPGSRTDNWNIDRREATDGKKLHVVDMNTCKGDGICTEICREKAFGEVSPVFAIYRGSHS